MKKSRGFTLTELLAVIVILGILVAIAIPVYFNITRTVKNSEYESKKKYIEGIAVNYAEEHNITTSLVFTPSRLIANGYMSADKYVMEGDEEIPFIINPSNDSDNLACHPITLSIEDYEYSASMSDESNCALSSQDTIDEKIGIKAYRLNGNTIGDIIGWEEFNKTLNWVNTDVLLTVNPQYNGEIIISTNGNSTIVDKSKMLTNPRKGLNISNDYSNIVVIRAQKILRSDVSINIKVGDGLKTSTVGVRIDKEVPIVNTENFTGWVSRDKKTLVYLSDGNGSGPAGVYVTTNRTFSSSSRYAVTDTSTNTALVGGLSNGTYYLWPYDRAGNVATTPTQFEIKNVDTNPPQIKASKWTIDSDVSNPTTGAQGGANRKAGIDAAVTYDRSRKAIVTIEDKESGMQKASYCITTAASCTPNISLSSLNNSYEFAWTTSRNAQRICYNATDNVGNTTGVVCTDAYLVDGTAGSLNSYTFDNIRTISLSLKDDESGIYRYKVQATNQSDASDVKICEGYVGSGDYYSSNKLYTCLFRYLTAARNYTLTVTGYNRANMPLTSNQTLSTHQYKVDTGYKLCNASNNWCTGDDFGEGVFVKYGDYEFVLYKNENGAIYGVSAKQNMMTSLINADCCDRNRCHAEYITDSNTSGIWGDMNWSHSVGNSLLNYFNRLPNNRTSVALNKTWNVDSINGSNFNIDISQNNTARINFADITDDYSIHISNGYTYYFPDDSDVVCYMDNGSQINDDGSKGKLNASIPDRISEGIHKYRCVRTRSNDEMTTMANQQFNITYGRDYEPTNPIYRFLYPNDTANYNAILNRIKQTDSTITRYINVIATRYSDDDSWDGTYNTALTIKTLSDDLNTTNRFSITARYGALTYNDYNTLKTKSYFQNMNDGQSISTLLATYVEDVVYGEDFKNVYSRAVGHDGTYSSISGLVAKSGGYFATTPMAHGTSTIAMVIPFNPNTPFTGGIGTESNPFIINGTWR